MIQFCEDCGDLLPVKTLKTIDCECCKASNKNTGLSQATISKSNDFPSLLRAQRSNIHSTSAKEVDTTQRIRETCPKCGSPEMTWSEIQMRSADEGSTIFYRCPICSHSFNSNN